MKNFPVCRRQTQKPSSKSTVGFTVQSGCETLTDLVPCVLLDKYNTSTNGGGLLSFQPSPDDMTSFSNYTDLQVRGRFAKLPTILSQVDNEGASLVPYNPAGPNQPVVDAFTRNIATYPGAQGAL